MAVVAGAMVRGSRIRQDPMRSISWVVRGSVAVAALCGVVVMTTGCAAQNPMWEYPHAYRASLSETKEEHAHRVRQVKRRDRRALTEDLDLFFMTDRATRLTRWHDR